ncbi:MAG: noncanonical pyrimidine nucleotidase, YjjG family [Flavobacterium sp.]|uniref:YjjG family noncanonical pyrimidine nucleotidase n=1 Tax=Flavobacterium sp. TaxID=239 RepID=UPI000C6168D5|nr:YjjG family noncanonical pyrimidine nucleotidase [Flavobacterium sp.]MBF01961.1 noncanonical pyrimidine nucleotidase, YjjG family [Flavobacterium sp.]|tara:strand:+ start:2039 stop:2728 length:690 start_codon:yes stop_codon:yes gene_type:complete
MIFKNKKHLFFDLDHTLWDFDKNSEVAFDIILKKYDFGFSLQDFLEHYIPKNQYYWSLYQINQISQEDLRFRRLNDVFEILNTPIAKQLVNQISEEYIELLPNSNHLFEGTIEILEYLKPKYHLHIVTNGFHYVQDKKMKNANIFHYFSTITNSELAGVKKPHPTIFEYALSLAKATKQDSVMIGDSIEADIKGALDFGIDAIFFNEKNIKINKNIPQINRLVELKKLL